jgi:hypothetical protein
MSRASLMLNGDISEITETAAQIRSLLLLLESKTVIASSAVSIAAATASPFSNYRTKV